jgi:hypothetical protein
LEKMHNTPKLDPFWHCSIDVIVGDAGVRELMQYFVLLFLFCWYKISHRICSLGVSRSAQELGAMDEDMDGMAFESNNCKGLQAQTLRGCHCEVSAA